MDISTATREVYWNISYGWLLYVFLAVTAVIAGKGIYRHFSLWKKGLPADRFDRPGERLQRVLVHALAQRRTVREKYAAVFHTSIYTGFIVLTIATTVVMIHEDFGLHIMQGAFYLYFQSFFVDVFGGITLVGIGIAAYRRLVLRPSKLVYTDQAVQILALIFAIVLTGFLVEGWRIAATNDPWGAWSPLGFLVGKASLAVAGPEALRLLHKLVWWSHAVLVFGFLAWAPYTKMLHVVMAPLNIYTGSLEPVGANLKSIDIDKAMETGAKLGVNSLSAMTWKDLADFDACTECGRCTAACPAHRVGKELSPRDIILDLQGFMRGSWNEPGRFEAPLVGAVPATSSEALWQCTTCAACVESCPVYIEQFPKIVDMRRYLVMEEAVFPDTMQDAITSLESRGHPFKGTQATRIDWTEGLNLKTAKEAGTADVILWVGCGGALIERNQKVSRSIAELLQEAGVNFSILGREEKCTGDPARRIGNEFLFEMLAKENTEKLNGYGVKTIVTSCPHCFNTFRNEYPQYGGNYEVVHHSEYLARLVEEGKLKAEGTGDKKITYHDPCYLGRHNGVYDAPRQLIQISSRKALVEVEQSRNNSFCCGGGGGMSFVDEPKDKRVNQERANQLLETGAEIVAVGCPFCTTMLEDGLNARKGDREIRVMDVSEILLESIKGAR